MTDNILFIIAFLFSTVCGFVFIPLILNFCKEKNLYDIPNSRKLHKNAIPRLGGISFLPSMLIAMVLSIAVANNQGQGGNQVTFSLWSLYFFISLLLIYGVGIIDDMIGLSAKSKFVVQIVASSLLPFSGLYLNNFYGFMGIDEIPCLIGAPLTVFVIVFISNAINLIDGIDGLAAGLSLIGLGGFLFCFMREGILAYALLIAGLMGVLIPFLYFNMLGSPDRNRKIFMGDSGSLTLGFILGFLVVKYSMDNPNVKVWHDDCLLLSYTFVIVPVFDVVRVSLLRICHRRPIFEADKNHLHHKMLRMGLTQHQVLVCILLLALGFIVFNALLHQVIGGELIVGIDIVVWIIFQQFVNMGIRKKGQPIYLIQKRDE